MTAAALEVVTTSVLLGVGSTDRLGVAGTLVTTSVLLGDRLGVAGTLRSPALVAVLMNQPFLMAMAAQMAQRMQQHARDPISANRDGIMKPICCK